MKKKICISILFLFFMFFIACKAEYTISFVTNNGTEIVAKTVTKGEKITDLPTLSKTGYEFLGWFTDEGTSKKYDDSIVESDMTLYAGWKKITFSVKFMNNNELVKEEIVEYGSSATAPTVSLDGKTFRSWDKSFDNVVNNLVVNALFDVNVYKVKFYNGDTLLEEQDVLHGAEASAPVVESTDEYKFVGWDKEFADVREDLVVKAKFEKNKFKVSFYSDGVQIGQTQEVEYGDEAIAPNPPEKARHEFVKWDKEFSSVKEDLKINAIYEVNVFEVRFFIDGIQVGETQKVRKGETASIGVEPTKTGYTFIGWNKDLTNVNEDMLVGALFIKNTYTVTFMVDGEVYGEVQYIDYGEDAVEPNDPIKDGYTFIGWDSSLTSINQNLVINAEFELLELVVEFYDGDTLLEEGQNVQYGKDAIAPQNPIKEGYNFVSWDKEFTNIKTDLIIKAVWEKVIYTIEYFDENAPLTIANPISYTIEDEVKLPTYDKESYYFIGWHKNADFSDEVCLVIEKGNHSNISLYAHFVEVDFNEGTETWVSGDFDATNTPSKGINAISDLPQIFMQDFYKYLKDNDLLDSSAVSSELKALTWDKFIGLNPNHNGDPVKVCFDTTNNYSSGNPGYAGLYLYESASGNTTTGELYDINGGFLGTEPYKTKYWYLSQHLAMLQMYKYTSNSFYSPSNANRVLTGFLIDGYFYGTQKAEGTEFTALRSVIPGTTFGYKFSGTNLVKVTKTYKYTTSNDFTTLIAAPIKKGYVLTGWYYLVNEQKIDLVSLKGLNNQIKLYAKWEKIE